MFVKDNLKKYQPLLIAITLFLVLFVTVVLANFVMQNNIVNAINHNIMAQDLVLRTQSPNKTELKKLLTNTSNNKNYITLTNKKIESLKLNEEESAALNTIQTSLKQDDPQKLQKNVNQFNAITNKELQRKQKLNRSFLLLSVLFAIIIYLVVLVQIIRRLSTDDENNESSKKETENIMSTVSEGLFLLGRDCEIGIEQSESLKKMFDSEHDLEGNFIEFIRKYITESDVENARDYIDILFGERVKEKLIAELNPLTRVKVHITRLDGSISSRYLSFNFKRVIQNDKLVHLLVSTTDITKQVLLEEELEATKEKQESQIDLLMSILHVKSESLSSFFESTESVLTEVNDTLKETGHGAYDLKNKVNVAYENIHKVKGDAASLGLHKFEALAHEIEEGLDEIKHKVKIEGQDLLEFTTKLKSLFVELEQMKSLVDKISGIRVNQSPTTSNNNSTANTDEENTLLSLANTVAARANKPIALSTYGFNDELMPEDLKDTAHDIAIQLIRNSIVHGIEETETRLEAKKSSIAHIVCNFAKIPEGGYELTVRDDGAGINEEKVISNAIKMNIITDAQATKITSQAQIAKLLFTSGLSTKDEADLDAGRGVGLGLVRSLTVEKKGRIRIGYEKGKFCYFKIIFPAAAA